MKTLLKKKSNDKPIPVIRNKATLVNRWPHNERNFSPQNKLPRRQKKGKEIGRIHMHIVDKWGFSQ